MTNLIGKTDIREFVRLMYHAAGVLCPVTFAMHLAAAVPTKPGIRRARACVVVAGGRESPHWEAYPQHQFLHTVGALPCCDQGGCWKSRCQLVGDGDEKDRKNLCEMPVQVTPDLRIPRCMEMLTPQDVIRRIDLYLEGPTTQRGAAIRPAPKVPVQAEPALPSPPPTPATSVLLKFRHGLGDAVQLTTILQHLKHYHSDWRVDVAALIGKHSAFHGLCSRVFVLDREELPGNYDRILELNWDECHTCYPHCPSTKAERCLQEIFHLAALPDLCTYRIQRSETAMQRARAYLEQICAGKSSGTDRFPAVLIHYEGNTSGERKNLPVAIVRQLCEKILGAGYVPVILDWDRRTPLADGASIHNPNTEVELWGRTGTGDAEILAALTELCALMIGVDSGPLHVAGATSTPTIAVWTGHHPLHYFGHAANVLHLVPENHSRMLRGDRVVGDGYFEKHYRFRTYQDLGPALIAELREHLKNPDDTLVHTHNFWIRNNNAEQDLVVVQDIAEQDSYHIAELPMPRPVVVDVGAHIGCFSRKFHERNPLARVIAVECCPENIAALRKNVGGFATVVQAAVTYEQDVALMNAVFPNCVTTGGSTIIRRQELNNKVAKGELPIEQIGKAGQEYWADFRPVETMTLEQILERYGVDRIDFLKLDCEGSEFSILHNTAILDRIGVIVGEYHGKARFDDLIAARFPGWQLRMLKDGELGTFWLSNPRRLPCPWTEATP